MNLEHIHNLSNAEFLTAAKAHPAYWDHSPAALMMKDAVTRLEDCTENTVDEIKRLEMAVDNLEESLDQAKSEIDELQSKLDEKE